MAETGSGSPTIPIFEQRTVLTMVTPPMGATMERGAAQRASASSVVLTQVTRNRPVISLCLLYHFSLPSLSPEKRSRFIPIPETIAPIVARTIPTPTSQSSMKAAFSFSPSPLPASGGAVISFNAGIDILSVPY